MSRAPLFVLVLLLFGCGGEVGQEVFPDTGAAAPPSEAALDAPLDGRGDSDDGGREAEAIAGPYGAGGCASPCPALAPKSGDVCANDGLECEYGGAFDPKCNLIARCSGGRFTRIDPSGLCPASSSECPSSPFGPERGHSCPLEGAVCTYVDGVCGCQRESAGSASVVWACAIFTCKGPRARLGCSCNNALVCQHGGCTGELAHGVDLACRDGVWKRIDMCK